MPFDESHEVIFVDSSGGYRYEKHSNKYMYEDGSYMKYNDLLTEFLNRNIVEDLTVQLPFFYFNLFFFFCFFFFVVVFFFNFSLNKMSLIFKRYFKYLLYLVKRVYICISNLSEMYNNEC